MKKTILFSILLLMISGCGKEKTETLENKLEKLGIEYYSKYVKNYGLDIVVVSLKDLREANELMDDQFDISNFKHCDEESNVKIKLKKGTTQIESFEFELNCK